MSKALKFSCTMDASELSAVMRFCTCCERKLKGRVAFLELDQRIDAYHDAGGVPTNMSQGWFPFGLTCAAKQQARGMGLLATLAA